MITSRSNQKVKSWLSLQQKKERDKQNLFLVEGEHIIEEAIHHNRLTLLIKSETYTRHLSYTKEELVSVSVAQKLSSTTSKSDVFGLVEIKQQELVGTRWLFLDTIQDPGNVGTLIRSAVSFGYDCVITNQGCADVYSDKVVRATQGALFHINHLTMEFEQLKSEALKHNIKMVGTYLKEQGNDLLPSNHLCICLGNEGSGLNVDYQSQMDLNVLVETSNFESLNVAVAGSILLYQSKR